MMATITLAQHIRHLKSMGNVDRVVQDALYRGGRMIEKTAEDSIKEGAISGPGHIPSRPGEPPNADTHVLDRNIYTMKAPEARQGVSVISDAYYAGYLEFGTRKMAARPYMKPAAQKNREKVTEEVATAVRRKVERRRK